MILVRQSKGCGNGQTPAQGWPLKSKEQTMIRILFVFLFPFLLFPTLSFSGIYMGLEPGLSKKSDADRMLGKPIKEIVKGERYEYDPKGMEARQLAVKFNKATQVIDGIDIIPQRSITKAKYQKWLGLKNPTVTKKYSNGNLVEYYVEEGIALLYSGPHDSYPVACFTHFNPLLLQKKTVEEGMVTPERKMEASKKIPERVEPSRLGDVASVLFEDTFESEGGRKGQLNYISFKNWDVIQGSVDLIGLGFWDYFPDHGLYVDLDGSTGKAGTLSSKKIFSLAPGSYRLEFDLAGNPLSGPNTVTVRLGKVYNEVFTLGVKEPFRKIARQISVSVTEESKLVFQHAGGDNDGLLLDNIRLMKLSPSLQVPKSVSPPSQRIPESPSPPSRQAIVQNRQYYETEAKQTLGNKDFQKLRRILDEGLIYFPDSAALWSYEGAYYFSYNESGPLSFRREKA